MGNIFGAAALATAVLFAATTSSRAMTVVSTDVADGQRFAAAQVNTDCGGQNVSPALAWKDWPAGTQSFAVTIYDPDAQGGWWHWIVYDIPAATSQLPHGAASLPQGARSAKNSYGNARYDGACPPPGSGAHHYNITVWALGSPALAVGDDASADRIGGDLKHHALASAVLTAIYER